MSEPTPQTPPPYGAELHTRTVGCLHLAADTSILVEHVFEPEGVDTCECGNPTHDPGLVGLLLSDEDETAGCLMTAEEALVLANRLQRAAGMVLESMEDVPDVEREAARYSQRSGS